MDEEPKESKPIDFDKLPKYLFKQDETTYVFLEKYKDQEAQDAHGKTDYFRELGAQMGPFMAGAPEIKVLQLV